MAAYFKEKKNGYDRAQVDKYIRKLKEAYENVYKDYLEIYDKYCDLVEDNEDGGSIFFEQLNVYDKEQADSYI